MTFIANENGVVYQRIWARGLMLGPSDVAGIASFLVSEDSDYVTSTTVVVDGGLLWNYQEQ